MCLVSHQYYLLIIQNDDNKNLCISQLNICATWIYRSSENNQKYGTMWINILVVMSTNLIDVTMVT